MARGQYKDWQPGTCRLKMELVTPLGNRMEIYMPSISEREGMCLMAICNGADRGGKDDNVNQFFDHVHGKAKALGLI